MLAVDKLYYQIRRERLTTWGAFTNLHHKDFKEIMKSEKAHLYIIGLENAFKKETDKRRKIPFIARGKS